MNAADHSHPRIDPRTVRLANQMCDAARAKYGDLWRFVSVDVRRDLALAQAAMWCTQQDDQTMTLARITPVIDRIMTAPEFTF